MHISVKKWGNSASIRIPASINLHIDEIDEVVDIHEKNDRIMVESTKSDNDLTQLFSDIKPENLHREVSFGGAVDNEIL